MNEISFINPNEVTITPEVCEAATGVTHPTVQDQALISVAHIAPAHADALEWALQQMASHKPQDAVESALVQQMIALNSMMMKSSMLALSDGQTVAGWEMHVKLATRLSNAFAKVSVALDKHRGKGRQTIVVEHQQVNVASGGQAVIGDVCAS